MVADHYVPQPRFLFFLRLIQIGLALVTLAMTAFAMAKLNSYWISGTFGYSIFCCIFTLLSGTYLLVSEAHFVDLWNRWVALAFDIIGVLFWISAWGSLAAWAAVNDLVNHALSKRDALPVPKGGGSGGSSSSSTADDDYSSYINMPSDMFGNTSTGTSSAALVNLYNGYQAAWKCTAAAAGLGAIIWVLYVVALITYSIALHRFRRARREGGGAAVQVVQEPKGQHEMGTMAPAYQQQQPVAYEQQQQPVAFQQQQPPVAYQQQQPPVAYQQQQQPVAYQA